MLGDGRVLVWRRCRRKCGTCVALLRNLQRLSRKPEMLVLLVSVRLAHLALSGVENWCQSSGKVADLRDREGVVATGSA